MSKQFKRGLSVLLTALMVLTMIPLMSFAEQTTAQAVNAPASNPPLSIEISTSKNSYTLLSQITYSVTVTNKSSVAISNVSAEALFGNDIAPLTGSQIKAEKASLAPGESLRFSYNAQLKSFKALDILLLPLKWIFASGSTMAVTDNGFNDGREYTETTTRAKLMSLFNSSYDTTSTARVWYGNSAIGDYMEFSVAVAQMVKNATPASGIDMGAAADNAYYSKRVIVKTSTNLNLDTYNTTGVVKGPDGYAVLQFASEADAKNCLDQLNATSQVQYAEMDRYMHTCEIETESVDNTVSIQAAGNTYYSWGVQHMEADKYSDWLASAGYTSTIKVAVVDTGVSSHTFLSGKLLAGYDFVDNDSNPADENRHGTHVAGTIVDCTQPLNAKIMPIRVLDRNGSGSWVTVANGIRYAADNGAAVINLSLGGDHSQTVDDAVAYAINKGVTVVVAAGNESQNTSNVCPAHITNAVTVAAIDSTNTRAYFSNYGAAVDVAAPGVNINSCNYTGGYVSLSGTSMATPHVVAVAAMCKLRNPSATPAQIEQMIKNCAKDLGTTGRDDYYGYGVPQLSYFMPAPTTYTITYNPNGGSVSRTSDTVNAGNSVTTPTPTKSYTLTYNVNGGNAVSPSSKSLSCTVNGWYTATSGGTKRANAGAAYTPTQTETIYAQWTNPTAGTLPTPTYPTSGYTFKGWFTAASGGTQVTSSTIMTGDQTVFAQWNAPNTYTVTYDPNGGSVSRTSDTVNAGSSVTTPTPTKSYTLTYNVNGGNTVSPSSKSVSCSCNGWFTATSGGTKRANAGGSYTPTQSETIYAQWTNPTAGTLPTPTHPSGHTFKGWFTAASGGTQITSTTTMTGNQTIYAQWTVTVTYNANGGSVSPTSATVDAGSSATTPTPTKNYTLTYNVNGGNTLSPSSKSVSCTCTGWFTAASGGTKRANAGASYIPTQTETLYAQWSNPSMGALPTPTYPQANYSFKGWFTAASGGTQVTSSTTMTGNQTIYAQWVFDYEYTINGSNVTITKYVGSGGAVSIPSTIEGKTVTVLANGAFQWCDTVTSVSIPNGVTQLGQSSFYGCKLLTSISIPTSLMSIGDYAFWDCEQLQSITIPSSVTSIGRQPFNWCYSLNTITVNSANTVYASSSGVLYNKSLTTLICYPQAKTGTSFTVPSTVTSIESYAFTDCELLKTITLQSGVRTIGTWSFYGCTALTTITLPSSVTSLGQEVFYACSSLSTVYFSGNAPSVVADVGLTGGLGRPRNALTVYYKSGTTGWSNPWNGYPTATW